MTVRLLTALVAVALSVAGCGTPGTPDAGAASKPAITPATTPGGVAARYLTDLTVTGAVSAHLTAATTCAVIGKTTLSCHFESPGVTYRVGIGLVGTYHGAGSYPAEAEQFGRGTTVVVSNSTRSANGELWLATGGSIQLTVTGSAKDLLGRVDADLKAEDGRTIHLAGSFTAALL